MTNNDVLIVDDSFESIKSLRKRFTKTSILSGFKKYLIFLMVETLCASSMYVDHKYTNNLIPVDYLVENAVVQNINTHHSRMLLDDNILACKSDANCGNGTCRLVSNNSGIVVSHRKCIEEYI